MTGTSNLEIARRVYRMINSLKLHAKVLARSAKNVCAQRQLSTSQLASQLVSSQLAAQQLPTTVVSTVVFSKGRFFSSSRFQVQSTRYGSSFFEREIFFLFAISGTIYRVWQQFFRKGDFFPLRKQLPTSQLASQNQRYIPILFDVMDSIQKEKRFRGALLTPFRVPSRSPFFDFAGCLFYFSWNLQIHEVTTKSFPLRR